jgi:hypothetical protein
VICDAGPRVDLLWRNCGWRIIVLRRRNFDRWHKSFKECIRPGTPLSLEDARRLVEGYVEHYNNVRLNSAIGYITPKDMLAGHQQEIQAERDRKLEAAREQRKNRRLPAAWRMKRITSGLPTILPRLPGSAFLASDGRLSGYPTHQDFKKPYSFAWQKTCMGVHGK